MVPAHRPPLPFPALPLLPPQLKRRDGADRPHLKQTEEDEYVQPPSIHSMSTAEWRAKYEKNGMIDLWVEEEFNSGSRLVVSES